MVKICIFCHNGIAPHLQEDTVMSFLCCWGPLQPLRAPISSTPSPLCCCGWHRQVLELALVQAGRGNCHTGWDGVTLFLSPSAATWGLGAAGEVFPIPLGW